MRIVRASLVALPCLLLALRAGAQGAHDVRAGFYGSAGIGYGNGSCTGGCTSSSQNGVGYYLALGGTLNQHLRLGVEGQLWTKTQGGGTLDVNYYLASLSYYPSAASAFWIKANVGYTEFKVHLAGVPTTTSSGGGAAGIGLGYDWQPVAGTFVLIPFAEYTAQLSSSNGQPKGNLLLVGLGFGYKH
jgi:hypothetical protein